MRLKNTSNSPARVTPRRLKGGLDLRRMMGIILNDQHLIHFPENLKPAFDPSIILKNLLDGRKINSQNWANATTAKLLVTL